MSLTGTKGMDVFNATYTAMSGCDIKAILGDVLLGNIQGLSLSITREKTPNYVMGSKDPVGFSRGKRGIAGSMIFSLFDRDALWDIMNPGADRNTLTGPSNIDTRYYAAATDIFAGGKAKSIADTTSFGGVLRPAAYIDQIPPFTITLTGSNEAGHNTYMAIYGVEFLNQGIGISIDDIANEAQCTFVARSVVGWQPLARGSTYSVSDMNASLEEKMKNTEAYRMAEATPA